MVSKDCLVLGYWLMSLLMDERMECPDVHMLELRSSSSPQPDLPGGPNCY